MINTYTVIKNCTCDCIMYAPLMSAAPKIQKIIWNPQTLTPTGEKNLKDSFEQVWRKIWIKMRGWYLIQYNIVFLCV